MAAHPIIHVELSSKDHLASGKFYSELFGWEIKQIPEMDYATFMTGEGVGGGFNPVSKDYPAGRVMVYVATEDVTATLAKAEELGGKIITPKMEIPGVGWFGTFTDLTGNLVAVLTPIMPQT